MRACDSCQRNKTYTGNTFANTQPTTPTKPGELLSIDWIGPYPTGRGGVKHALVMIDTFSKYVKIYPVRNATRITATRKLFNEYIPKQGAIEKVVADHGSQFKSPKWQQTLREAGIRAIRSSIRHPRGNMVERTNKEIGKFLRSLLKAKHSEWAH